MVASTSMKTPASLNLSAAPAALLPEKETTAIRTNFHSHTTRCNHATGRDEEYVQAAIAAGYRQLGISDHSPFPDHEGQVSGMRMHVTEFPDYLRSCQSLRENYAGEIEVFIGLEAEYYKPYHPWLLDLVQTHQLDYLILGSHYDDPIEDVYFGAIKSPRLLRRYTDHTIAGMRTGHFCALAHPELFMIGYPRFDADCKAASRDIIQAAIQLNLPLEYNLAGLYPQSWRTGPGYPTPGFWEIAAQEGATAIIGLDAHDPARYADTEVYDNAVQHLKDLGIKRIDSLVPCQQKQQAG